MMCHQLNSRLSRQFCVSTVGLTRLSMHARTVPWRRSLPMDVVGRSFWSSSRLGKPVASAVQLPNFHDSHHHEGLKSKGSNPIPDFDRNDLAYASKSTTQLLRSAVSFSICRVPFLVRHAESLLNISRKILGDRIVDTILKFTLYGHFCAGEDEERIRPVVQSMKNDGIGSILDYVAEGGPEAAATSSTHSSKSKHKNKEEELAEIVFSKNHPNVRVYNYTNEDECERHVEIFQTCIRDVAKLQQDGYTAIKVTALVDPKLLARLSRVLAEVRNLFEKFDVDRDGVVTRNEFESGVKTFFKDDDTKMMSLLDELDLEKSGGMIDYVSWTLLIKPQDLPQITQSCRQLGPLAMATPNDKELQMLERLYDRIHRVAKEAADNKVRVLVDAEQQLYQPAIDNLVLDLQRVHNDTKKSDHPVIYNTYQCYLNDAHLRLKQDVERSERLGHHFGAKVVRGAYMESERELAKKLVYPSPIHDTIEDTHASYDSNVRYLLEASKKTNNNVEIMLGSHNQASIQKAVAAMNELGIDRKSPTICFAQLYGMMDHVTYGLGRNDYRVYKYVPYGEVKLAMPYLIRRARENSSISSGATRELKLIRAELKRRMFG